MQVILHRSPSLPQRPGHGTFLFTIGSPVRGSWSMNHTRGFLSSCRDRALVLIGFAAALRQSETSRSMSPISRWPSRLGTPPPGRSHAPIVKPLRDHNAFDLPPIS